MAFERDHLPDPQTYYEAAGLNIKRKGSGPWRGSNCPFCESRDNFNINLDTGGFHCWGCAAKGGDVLAFHMAHACTDFVTAAKALGCWVEDGKPSTRPPRPVQLSPRDALSLIADDANYLAIFTGLLVNGKDLTESDREAALDAVARILKITGMYQ